MDIVLRDDAQAQGGALGYLNYDSGHIMSTSSAGHDMRSMHSCKHDMNISLKQASISVHIDDKTFCGNSSTNENVLELAYS